MTVIQEQAIKLIEQLSDEKIMAIITLAADELRLSKLEAEEKAKKKKAALSVLESLDLELPEGFNADNELSEALEEKYGSVD